MKSSLYTGAFYRIKGCLFLIAIGALNVRAEQVKCASEMWGQHQRPAMPPDVSLPSDAAENQEIQHGKPNHKRFEIPVHTIDSSQIKRLKSIPNWSHSPKGWHFDLWHGWMDAPYARSKWKSLWQTGAFGEAYLVGRYPAALGIRMGRFNHNGGWSIQLGYRKHITWHYQVGELLDERHYTNASVQVCAEKTYHKGARCSFGGQLGVGAGHQSIQIRAGPGRGNSIQNTRLSGQITPLLLRINHQKWGAFVGIGYGSAGILQTGMSYFPFKKRTFSSDMSLHR